MRRLGVSVRRELLGVSGAFVSLTLLAGTLHAESSSDPATARALFAEGRKLMAAKHYDQACPKLEESQRLDSGIGTMYNLADCWEHSGRTASAWAMFLDTAAAARAANQSAREHTAKDRAAALEPKLSHITVHVATAEPGLEVRRDGTLVGAASYDTPVPVDPGPHRIDVTAPGKKDYTANIDVAASASLPVQIPKLENAPVAAAAAADPASPAVATPAAASTTTDTGPTAPGRSKVLPFTLIGIGVAGVALGTVFEVLSRSANSDALGICPAGAPCTQDDINTHDSKVSTAKSDRTIGFVGLGVGAASLITGAVLLATGHSASAAQTGAFHLNFAAGAHGAAALAEGRF